MYTLASKTTFFLKIQLAYMYFSYGKKTQKKTMYGKCPKNSNTKASDKMTYTYSVLKEQSDQSLHCLPFH